jgi:glycosyltransferase involved in cell wall biosynthesis
MSLVVLEAAAAGAPVIVTDRCGFDDVAHVDRRLLVAATGEAIAASVCSLLADRAALARAGRELKGLVLSRYDWGSVIERFIALSRSVLAAEPNDAARHHRHR